METAVCYSDQYPDSDPPDDGGDEFYYGHRTIIEYDETGEEIYRYVPLTPD